MEVFERGYTTDNQNSMNLDMFVNITQSIQYSCRQLIASLMEWNELTVFMFIMTIATFEGIIIKYTHFKKITKYPEENRR